MVRLMRAVPSCWVRPPSRTAEVADEERHATWLELLFDLGGREPVAEASEE
jgi:hypothetical protein